MRPIELLELLDKKEVNERFNEAFKHIIENMEDEQTKATAKRKINLEIVFDQDESREVVDIDVAIKESLAPKIVKVKVMETGRQLPGQMSISEYSEEERKRAAAELRNMGVDVVDPTTGEVIN